MEQQSHEEPTEEQMQIIEAIMGDPNVTDKALASRFKMSEDQMQRRLSTLKDREWWNWRRVVNTASLGFGLRYRIDVKINPLLLRNHLPELKGRPVERNDNPQKILARYIKNTLANDHRFKRRVIVEDITIVMGDPADLCVTVRVQDHDDVFEWVTGGLRAVGGIENTSTCLEAWSVLDGRLSEGNKKQVDPER